MFLSLFIAIISTMIVGNICYKQARDDAESEDRRLYNFEIGALMIICVIISGISFLTSHYVITSAIGYFLPVTTTVERHTLVSLKSDGEVFVVLDKEYGRYITEAEEKVYNVPIATTKIRFDSDFPIRMLKQCEVEFTEGWYKWIARTAWLETSWSEIILISEKDIASSDKENLIPDSSPMSDYSGPLAFAK